MPSVVAICNTALSRLGDSATVASIDPPEGSAQAEHCAVFYPIARDTLLEMHEWGFATRRASLALLSNQSSWNWRYAYARPSSCIKVISVLREQDCAQDRGVDYQTEANESGTQVILTNLENATVRYIAQVQDSTKFSPLFTDALAWLLASYLAGPVIKGDVGREAGRACYATFMQQMSAAKVSDSNQQSGDPRRDERQTEWIAARGYGLGHRFPRGY